MKWAIYARDGFEGAKAFSSGLLKVGEKAGIRSLSDYGPDCLENIDIAVVFGLQGKGLQIQRDYQSADIPVIVIDYGYLKRSNHVHDWKTGHWQVSLGGLNQIPEKADSSRFDALGLSVLEKGGRENGYPLLCVQTPDDMSHGMSVDELQVWCEEQAQRWPGLIIRPHPLRSELDYGLPVCTARNLNKALSGARLVVTANSNTGNDALLAGVPVIATHSGASWADLSGETLPSLEERLDYFHRCAWGQWTWEEFRAGLPQRYLLEKELT